MKLRMGEKEMNTTKPNIDEWVRDPEEAYVYPDGKSIVLNMKKLQPKYFFSLT